jgi:hypothetical protein
VGDTSHWLVTFEWINHAPGGSKTWRRENERVHGCPALWWCAKLEQLDRIVEEKQEAMAEREAAMLPIHDCDRPPNEDYRFLYATPISPEGFNALEGAVG